MVGPTSGSMAAMQQQEIVDRLLQLRETRGNKDWDALPPEVAALVRSDPFAFLIAVCFDRGMDWERAWQIPWEIFDKGFLQPERLAGMTESELKTLLDSLPIRPRWGTRIGAKTLSDAATLVHERYGGDAGAIWREAPVAKVVLELIGVHGVSTGIAHMTCRILHDDFGCFRGEERQIDVKPDSHLRRVFQRAGLISKDSEEMAIWAARYLNPDFPGNLDWGTWRVGNKWCRPKNPKCPECYLGDCCPQII